MMKHSDFSEVTGHGIAKLHELQLTPKTFSTQIRQRLGRFVHALRATVGELGEEFQALFV
jgi:hypothetical protein